MKTRTFHTTVATLPDGTGASARMLADQLGHSRVSLTQDVHLGRRVADAGDLAASEFCGPAPTDRDIEAP